MQQEIYETEGYIKNTEPVCDNMWANVNYKYSFIIKIMFFNFQWSNVYYIKMLKNCGTYMVYRYHVVKDILIPPN